MCVVRDSVGGGVMGVLLLTLAVCVVVTLVVLAGNAVEMLWRDGRVVNLWGASSGDVALALTLSLPVIPAAGAGRRRRCGA